MSADEVVQDSGPVAEVTEGQQQAQQPAGEAAPDTNHEAEQAAGQDEQGKTNDEGKDEQGRDADGKFTPKRSAQDRINQVVAERYEAERKAAYWQGIAEGRTNGQPAQQQVQIDPAAEPKLEDFDSVADYHRAIARHEYQRLSAAEREATRQQEVVRGWSERVSKASETIPDFVETVEAARTPVNGHVQQAIMSSEAGAQLLYYLAKNPSSVAKLNNMSPLDAFREVGRIEATLAAKPAPRTVTNAPQPLKPVTGGKSGVFDPQTASMEEYIEYRKKQGASWSR